MMEEYFPFVAILAVVLFAVAMMYISHLVARKRTEALAQIAYQLNFTFTPKDAGNTFLSQLGCFELSQRGHGKRITNLMQGTLNGAEIDLFDYTYVTGSGKYRHTYTQSVLRFTVEDRASWSPFSLRPEGVFEKVGAWLGSQDIDFADYPVFSGLYLLRGVDEAAVRTTFTPQVLSFYESLSQVCTEGNGRHLLYYRPSCRINQETIAGFLQEGMAALSQFCPSVSGDIYLPIG